MELEHAFYSFIGTRSFENFRNVNPEIIFFLCRFFVCLLYCSFPFAILGAISSRSFTKFILLAKNDVSKFEFCKTCKFFSTSFVLALAWESNRDKASDSYTRFSPEECENRITLDAFGLCGQMSGSSVAGLTSDAPQLLSSDPYAFFVMDSLVKERYFMKHNVQLILLTEPHSAELVVDLQLKSLKSPKS